jgi:hypothetical protein
MNEEAACSEVTPYVFEDPDNPKTALAYCAVCPVRAWCLRQVQPASSYFDGIAGGHVWKEGQHRGGDRKDPILRDYLRARDPNAIRRARRSERSKDPVKVRQFLDGWLPVEELTRIERRLAAAWLIGEGWTRSAAIKHCHVGHRTELTA